MENKSLIIFTDSGDTIINEGTEVRDKKGIVIHAELIPGAGNVLKKLHDEGYRICMVADGEVQSFTNVYIENGLGDCFDTRTISEEVGIQKPSALMFEDAMRKNNLSDNDKKRIVMIGNNVRKDIAGANRFGITSILLDWSPRYNMVPANDDEKADYIIHSPEELPELLNKIDSLIDK